VNAATRKKCEADIRRKFTLLKDSMDERVTRHWAATEAEALGYGGVAVVARATGIAPSTIGFGRQELRSGDRAVPLTKVRRPGGGRRAHEVVH
ncbi:hypothetical protein ACI3PL_20755, partial [Lacticaseibacillus paracasei]